MVDQVVVDEKGCLFCYEGIEKFIFGVMMEFIEVMGLDFGDLVGCVVCYGGNLQGFIVVEVY